jgi:hypothetical protein
MRGGNEMTFNSNYAELLGRELQRERMREADRERLIKEVSGWNPGLVGKLLIVLQDRWTKFWSRTARKKTYIPVSGEPKNYLSL